MAKQGKRSAPPSTTSSRKAPSKAKATSTVTKSLKAAAYGKRPAKKVTTPDQTHAMREAQTSAEPTGQPKAATAAKSQKRKARDTAAQEKDAETLPAPDSPAGTLQSVLPIEGVDAHTDLATLSSAQLLSIVKAVKAQLAANGTPHNTSSVIKLKRSILRWLGHHLSEAIDLNSMLSAVGVVCDFADLIGEGNTAQVYLGTYTVDDSHVAIKRMKFEGNATPTAEELSLFNREAMLHGSLEHANVLRLHRVLPSYPPALILEYANESLLSHIRRVGPLDEATASQYALQIVHGLQHVHGCSICHADIKIENILVGHDDTLRIADFGSAYVHPAPDGFVVGTRGTPYNCAPEQWTEDVAEEPSDKMVDVWALGIIIYEMLTMRHPFTQISLDPVVEKAQFLAASQPGGAPLRDPAKYILTQNYASDMEPILSANAQDLLDRIFTRLPGDRISLADIATHAWMRPRTSVGTVSAVFQRLRSFLHK